MEPVTQPNTPLHQTPVPNAGAGDLTGRTLGDYHILRQLGQGGMGQVFLAEQVSLKRKVALKLLRPETANNPTALARFQKEAEAVARFTHANIVQVYQIGQVEGLVFMALEYVEGRNLREYLARKGPPDALLALSIMRQVAGALQRAGELGLVHRDIKPENILLTRKGEVKVADFGLVRCLSEDSPGLNLTQSGVTMGTPLYMSPEQVEGKLLDCRSDIYSFGVTCYHMLAGQPPFTGENAFEVAFKHVRNEAVPLEKLRPDLPEGLCALVAKMMAKDPGQRHQTGRELLRDITKVREGLSGLTAAVPTYGATVELVPASELRGLSDDLLTVPSAPSEPRRRSRLLVLIPLSLLVAILLGIGVAWSQRERNALPPPHPTPDAVVVEAVTDEKRREQSLDNLVGDRHDDVGVRRWVGRSASGRRRATRSIHQGKRRGTDQRRTSGVADVVRHRDDQRRGLFAACCRLLVAADLVTLTGSLLHHLRDQKVRPRFRGCLHCGDGEGDISSPVGLQPVTGDKQIDKYVCGSHSRLM